MAALVSLFGSARSVLMLLLLGVAWGAPPAAAGSVWAGRVLRVFSSLALSLEPSPVPSPKPSPDNGPLPSSHRRELRRRRRRRRRSPRPAAPSTPNTDGGVVATGNGGGEGSAWVDPQNAARADVSLPPLTWSAQLADLSTAWANQIVGACQLKHDPDNTYGENIYYQGGADGIEAAAVAWWVKEKDYYNYDSNSCNPQQPYVNCLHYTQIVWRDTKEVGCGTASCADGTVYAVCKYNPPGNWEGAKPY